MLVNTGGKMKRISIAVLVLFIFFAGIVHAADDKNAEAALSKEYTIGIDDVLDISILQPEKLSVTVSVSPDGSINFPYIGTVESKGLTLTGLQEQIQKRLSEGYMKYPVVSVFLRENRSKKYFVYGEVVKPGTYLLDENTTVLRAISTAGGFTKYGSSSRVKILRPKQGETGFETIKINVGSAMNGNPQADVVLSPGDMVVVSEGVF